MIFTKTCFFIILDGIWEVWGCPVGEGGPYEEIPSSFGRVWSYRTWGSRLSCFWKYCKLTSSPNTSKLVLGPPDWSSDSFESQGAISGAIKPIMFPKNDPHEKYFLGTWKTSKNHHCLIKWLPFVCLFVGSHVLFWPGLHVHIFSLWYWLACPHLETRGSVSRK